MFPVLFYMAVFILLVMICTMQNKAGDWFIFIVTLAVTAIAFYFSLKEWGFI